MLAEVKAVKGEIELSVKGNKKITLVSHTSFFVTFNININNTTKLFLSGCKELFLSGSYEEKEGRYIIEQVVYGGERFTTFEGMKTELGIDDQPIIGKISEHLKEESTNLPKVSNKEAEKKNIRLQAELNTAKNKRRNSKNKIKTTSAQIEEQKQQVEENAKLNKLNPQIQLFQATPNDDDAQLQAKDEKIIELEAKNKTTEQPKQGNGAKYTTTVGIGLSDGLITFIALERTVRLHMLVMIGISLASALVAGAITYAALPSTKVGGVKAQEVNENGKSK